MKMEVLFYLGIALMALSVVCGAGAGLFLRSAGKRLEEQLTREYGPKKH